MQSFIYDASLHTAQKIERTFNASIRSDMPALHTVTQLHAAVS
jgi:hypothetical protein